MIIKLTVTIATRSLTIPANIALEVAGDADMRDVIVKALETMAQRFADGQVFDGPFPAAACESLMVDTTKG